MGIMTYIVDEENKIAVRAGRNGPDWVSAEKFFDAMDIFEDEYLWEAISKPVNQLTMSDIAIIYDAIKTMSEVTIFDTHQAVASFLVYQGLYHKWDVKSEEKLNLEEYTVV